MQYPSSLIWKQWMKAYPAFPIIYQISPLSSYIFFLSENIPRVRLFGFLGGIQIKINC